MFIYKIYTAKKSIQINRRDETPPEVRIRNNYRNNYCRNFYGFSVKTHDLKIISSFYEFEKMRRFQIKFLRQFQKRPTKKTLTLLRQTKNTSAASLAGIFAF